MSNREFGFKQDVETKRYWGARGTTSLKYGLNLPWDRQNYDGDQDSKEFTDWINKEVIPYLDRRVKSDLLDHQAEVIRIDSFDGKYHSEASCCDSHGYLYIGCWEEEI